MTTLSGIITPTNIVTASSTETLTNKTINGSNNSLSNVDLTTAITGTLPVANGGTGATSLTSNNVLLGNGTSAVQAVAPGTSGNVLTSNGTTWQSTAPAGGGAWELLSSSTSVSGTYLDITLDTSYYIYKLIFAALDPGGNNKFEARLGYSTSSFYSVHNWKFTGIVGTSPSSDYGLSQSTIRLTDDVNADDGDGGAYGEIIIYRPLSINNQQPAITWGIGFDGQSVTPEVPKGYLAGYGNAYNNSTTVPELTFIRLQFEGAGFTAGSYYLCGLSTS